jgi:hypothetical protein
MNITSYNVTDVAYHYIGLRVLAANEKLKREELITAISRSVAQFVRDRALRLMLAAPRGTFETVGEKVCQELVHLQLAHPVPGSYELTDLGRHALSLLNSRQTRDLRILMIRSHFETYDNFRYILARHIETGELLRPIVEAPRATNEEYIEALLRPSFGDNASAKAKAVLQRLPTAKDTAKRTEDALAEEVLTEFLPQRRTQVPLFRAIADRMNSMRLLNVARHRIDDAEFVQTYPTCLFNPSGEADPVAPWRIPVQAVADGLPTTLWVCEPDTNNSDFLKLVRDHILDAFSHVPSEGGYHDLPDVRDFVARQLRIPEAAFDEALNALLDTAASPFSLGLQYERISGRRRPLQRTRESAQVFNLIRRQ